MSVFGLCILLAICAGIASQPVGRPGGAGYAVILNNNPLVKDNFNNFPTEALTFEAWISTYYTCHGGTLMSYAIDTETEADRGENLNHFVVSHLRRVLGCHDYERTYLSGLTGAFLLAAGAESCLQDFDNSPEELETSPTFERNGSWMHVAVTWSVENDGETIVYKNGDIAGRLISNKTRPIQPDGIFMLGGKQNCFGGCSRSREAYFGLMDEVRIWNVSRSQIQIQDFMTQTGRILENEEGLVAYWNFDDPRDMRFDDDRFARDLSGNENHLELFSPPIFQPTEITQNTNTLQTGALIFERNYALNKDFSAMPEQDSTIEFWARLLVRPLDAEHDQDLRYVENRYCLMSYVTRPDEASGAVRGVNLGALSIHIDLTEWNDTGLLRSTNFSTRGSTWVGFGDFDPRVWIEFDTKWLDDDWHHVALTQDHVNNIVRFFFDGNEAIPFWKNDGVLTTFVPPAEDGVGNELPIQEQSSRGSLALGIFQSCFGGCLEVGSALSGALANFRIWNRALTRRQIRNNMMRTSSDSNPRGLALEYEFTTDSVIETGQTTRHVIDQNGDVSLFLGSLMPHFEFSTAPLTRVSGRPLDPPLAGDAGYALQLSDQHIIVLNEFSEFPTDAITVEFSMWSIDQCNSGVPFSYSVEVDGQHVDMFTVANYNNWVLVVNGDSGAPGDTSSGFGSTDGLWHHIAVTWDRRSGEAALYDNGRLHWKGIRNQGVSLATNGTLVLGREQDCLGGCFDSASGAFRGSGVGLFDRVQDFFGFMDNVRIWNIVRTPSEIDQSLRFDLDMERGRSNDFITNSSEGLIAWWRFNEGFGRRLSDSTGNGHILRVRGTPLWTIPNRLESCGDGILHNIEECDDGNRVDGDGCDRTCRLERSENQFPPALDEEEVASTLDDSIEPPSDTQESTIDEGILLDDDIL